MENFEDVLEEEEEIKNIPWEERERIGFFKGIYLTIKEALFKPDEFFGEIKPGNIKNATLYALIIAGFFYFVNLLWISQQIEFNHPMIFLILLLPFASLILFFLLEVGLLHLGLLLFSSNKFGFSATFKVAAYSESVLVFSVVPIIGGIVSSIWGLLITIIGLSKAHNITIRKALFSTLFSIIASLLIVSIFFVIKEVVLK